VLAVFIMICLVVPPQRAGRHPRVVREEAASGAR